MGEKVEIKIVTNIDEFNKKINKLDETIKKAKSLADELANFEIAVDFKNCN